MKFSEYPYERPNIEEIKAYILTTAENIRNAPDAQTIIREFDAMQERTSDILSMGTIAYVRNTINTADAFYDAEREYFDNASPELIEAGNVCNEVMLDSPFRKELEAHYGTLLFKNMEIERRSFTPELIPLMQEENKLASQYQKLYASLTADFDGKTMPLPMLGPYKESPDRAIRRAAFEAEGKAFDLHREELDEIYDKLVKNRNAQGRLVGYENYIQLGYDRLSRNCYGGKELASFRDQIARDLVPIIAEVKKAQRERIGVEQMCIYDDKFRFVDGNAKPIGTAEEILQSGKEMYQALSPETKEFIEAMFECELFDVLSKEGKAPGGYCTSISKYKMPFIFSNFNGTSDDVDVLTHEAGHAFAAYRAMNNPEIIPPLQSPTIEACECHSMSMEFLTQDFHKNFFGENTRKYELAHCEDSLDFIPYGCMIDEFQHRMYENENLTPEQRHEVWRELEEKYRPWLSMDELPLYGRYAHWQWKLHVYLHPLYYIDYCMAQTVAFQLWMLSMTDREAAWKKYLAFVDAAGTKTFEELCIGAELKVPYAEGTVREIGAGIRDWLKSNAD